MKITEGTPALSAERICEYGGPKVGKTRLATSLPWGEFWGEKAVYVAADANAGTLKSVLSHNKGHLVVVTPDGTPSYLRESVGIARHDWKKDYPGVGTLIWDTMTETSRRLLHEYADSGVFSDKHAVQVGRKEDGSWHTSPMEGDYGAVHNTLALLLDHLWQQPLHLIILFEDDVGEPKSGSVEGLVGGPGTVGKKALRWIAAKFDTVLFLQSVMMNADQRRVIVNTVGRGIWPAGVRSDEKLKLDAQIPLDSDPKGFWEKLVPNTKAST